MQMDFRMRCQEVIDRTAFVRREAVGDYMDLLAAGLVDCDVGEEGNELGGGMPRGGFAEYLASLRVEGACSDKVP
ncbi:MAG: hypothetical protein JWM63_4233 [Gammaproteobacteria bacterium]|nr:hypothetical protein [Gammaproteobacteria bacterium]